MNTKMQSDWTSSAVLPRATDDFSLFDLVCSKGQVKKAEILTSWPLINAALQRGASMAVIYRTLKESAGLQCSYTYFCRIVNHRRNIND